MGDLPIHLLIVEDSDDDAKLLLHELRRGGYEPQFAVVQTAEALDRALDQGPWDLVVADYSMPGFSGTAALQRVRERGFDVPFIFVSGTIGEDVAVAAMRAGAQDYLRKGALKRLLPAIERELREAGRRHEAKQLELQLRQAQKMEAVGRLAGGVAHDFNNLLTVILGEAAMLLGDLSPESPIRKPVAEIKKAAERAAGLTRQLLAFSRRQLVEPSVFSLDQLVEDLEPMLRRLIGEHIELAVHRDPTAGAIKADRGQIEQILVNLLVNARDAMPHGGTLAIETANATLDEDYARIHTDVTPGHYVMLAVSDTGVGMTDEVKAHLFEPFFTTKEEGKGSGLGLATCYGIISQFRGHLAIYSEPGLGTTMKVYLPRVEEALTAEPAPAGPPPGGSETILVVEDDERVRAVTARMLRAQGYTVVEAADGAAALDLLSQPDAVVHLLLSDVVLPKMGGREVAERARAVRPGLHVLFASGYTGDVILQHQLLEHGVSLLQKPFTPDALARKVREVLDLGERP